MEREICGIKFNAPSEHLLASAATADRRHPLANDVGIYGQVREMEAFAAEAKSGRYCELVDAGAYFGLFSIVFCMATGGRSTAIEPSPHAFQILQMDIRANSGCDIAAVNAFLGVRGGPPVECSSAQLQLVADHGHGSEWQKRYTGRLLDSNHVTCRQVAIDDLPSIRTPDIMKIDVEGWEIHVILGAMGTITKHRPTIFLEAHTNTLPGHQQSGGELMELLRELDYECLDFVGAKIGTLDDCSMKRLICRPT